MYKKIKYFTVEKKCYCSFLSETSKKHKSKRFAAILLYFRLNAESICSKDRIRQMGRYMEALGISI